MDGLQQVGLPVLGIVAAAAVTFYVVSFSELREKSLNRDWDDDDNVGFKTSLSSRERRARRKARKSTKRVREPYSRVCEDVDKWLPNLTHILAYLNEQLN